MEFLRLERGRRRTTAVRHDGRIHDLTPLTGDIDGAFLSRDGITRTREALAAGELPLFDGAEALRVGAPIARPMAVLCIGQNYAAHAAESGDAPPTVPILFHKHPNTIVGPFDDVLIAAGSREGGLGGRARAS